MAEIAFGGNCSACGTLVACAGSYSDERLVGMCPVCQVPVTMQNHAYVAPATDATAAPEPEPAPVPEPEPAVPFVPEAASDNPLVDHEQQTPESE